MALNWLVITSNSIYPTIYLKPTIPIITLKKLSLPAQNHNQITFKPQQAILKSAAPSDAALFTYLLLSR